MIKNLEITCNVHSRPQHVLLRSTLPQTAVAELRILKLRDSEEDLSQVQTVIRQCSMQNRSTEQTIFAIAPETRGL